MSVFKGKLTRIWSPNLNKRIVDFSVVFVLILFAIKITMINGSRGLMAFDQSIIFHGAYKLLLGEIPYRDFVIPIGPISFIIPAVFFKIFGISYSVYIFSAAFINAMATLFSILILRRLFPNLYGLSYLAGALSSVWFCIPGTPWYETTAFLFILVSLYVFLSALSTKNVYLKNLFLGLSGAFVFVVFLSKQPHGVLILPLFFGLITLYYYKNKWKVFTHSLLCFVSGYIVSVALFVVWLFTKSNITNFITYTLKIPAVEGNLRIQTANYHLLTCLFGHTHFLMVTSFILEFLILCFLFKFYKKINLHYLKFRNVIISSFLIIYLYHFHFLMGIINNNDIGYAFATIGLIPSILGGVLLSVIDGRHNKKIRVAILMTCYFAALPLFFYGWWSAFTRIGNGFNSEHTYDKSFLGSTLCGLKWANPTYVYDGSDTQVITRSNITELVNYLLEFQGSYLILSDYQLLYSLSGKQSPAPIVWFHKGLTYSKEYDTYLDSWFVKNLNEKRVNMIVLESQYMEKISIFKEVCSYIQENFVVEREIGPFQILSRVKKSS